MAGTPFTGLFACLSDVYAVLEPDPDTRTFVPVEAWDATGQAWAVGDQALVQASTLAGFARLQSNGQVKAGRPERYQPPNVRIVHVPPGQAS